MYKNVLVALTCFLAGGSAASAANIYKVTSRAGDKTITYEVTFGGGRAFEQLTAFDPETKKFVYLQWPRGKDKPRAEATIWDHHTGEVVPLYKFPGAKGPLPAIPSIEAMKSCPITGDKAYKHVLHIIAD